MAACQQGPMMYPSAGGFQGSGNVGAMGGAGGFGGATGAAGGFEGATSTGTGACAGLCAGAEVGGAMSFVGQGRGDYTVVTTYKYVGAGAGEFGHVAPKKNGCALIVCGASLLIALIVLAVLLFPPTTSTTVVQSIGPSETGTCLVWGDPHVQSFDGAFTSFVAEGEYYLVKTDRISIQALLLATPFTEGLAATHEIAIGGHDLAGYVIRVGPMEAGQILLDGEPILTTFPSSQTLEVGSLSYTSDGDLVDEAQSHLEKHVLHVSLNSGVLIQVMRWSNHINVRISMQKTSPWTGADGLCGNFNREVSDDTEASIIARNAAAVPESECLFDHQGSFKPAPAHSLAECKRDPERYNTAVKLCNTANPALKQGCIFDVCFAGKRYAQQIGLSG